MYGLNSGLVFALELRSPITMTPTIQLFTSEGCSSCPPADRWLSTLVDKPGLFSQFIPMAFHVDYWDRLGWPDKFAEPAYSLRQRQLSAIGILSAVYTPAFVRNNREWRGWFSGDREFSLSDSADTGAVGVLTVDWPQQSDEILVEFTSQTRQLKSLVVNYAVLGMGVDSRVSRGENRGKLLSHDFVVLSMQQYSVPETNESLVKVALPAPVVPAAGQTRSALLVWIAGEESGAIVQAVAGYL
jgi:hypothetical protein